MSIFWGVNAFLRRWLYTPCSSSDVRWARIPSYFVVSVPFFLRQCFGWRWWRWWLSLGFQRPCEEVFGPKKLTKRPSGRLGWFIPTKIGGLCLWCVSFLICLLRFCLKMLLFSQEIDLEFFGSTPYFCCWLIKRSVTLPQYRIRRGCFFGWTALKTKMAMENPHVQLQIHVQMVDFPLPCSFSGGLDWNNIEKNKDPVISQPWPCISPRGHSKFERVT